MSEILDQTSDINGQKTHRLTTLFPPPEFVKNASSEAAYGPAEGLPLRCYGDPTHRLYPAHTKEATWLSALFFLDNKAEGKHGEKDALLIEDRLNKFAAYFGITAEVDELKSRVKTASSNPTHTLDNDDFALIVKYADGTVERHYPLRNPAEVKAAAQYLAQFQDVIPLEDRQQMGQRILDKAEKVGTTFDDDTESFLERQAGYGVCAAKDAADLVMSRVVRLRYMNKDASLCEELQKMAQACLDNSEHVRTPGSLTKLATVIDNIDRMYGLHRDYSDTFQRPEDVLFGITVKAAEHVLSDHCSMTTGKIYKIADFRKVALEDIRDVMGESFAEEVSVGGLTTCPEKLADIASTLPRPDAELLDRLLSKAGVVPVAKEAAHYEVGIDGSQLRDLAALR